MLLHSLIPNRPIGNHMVLQPMNTNRRNSAYSGMHPPQRNGYIAHSHPSPFTQLNNTIFSVLRSNTSFFNLKVSRLKFTHPYNMISAKQLMRMARKEQKMAAIRRKRISFPRTSEAENADHCSTSSTTEKGHFVVYSADEGRFVVPSPYINSNIFRELFKMSEKNFGLPSNGSITLPCDAVFIEYIISLVQQSIANDLEKALLTAIENGLCLSTSNLCQEQENKQLLMCGC